MDEEDDNDWTEYRQERREKKLRNREWSIKHLTELNIPFRVLSEGAGHYRITGTTWDFWPSTGVFYNTKTGEKGRGIKNLIKKLDDTRANGIENQ